MGKSSQRSMERRMMMMTREQLAVEREERRIQREILEKQKAEYKAFEFVNPYADVQNQFEDIGVATEAAELQLERGTQQRANILESLRGAAGSSGIAGLAQAMANQGLIQTQAVTADIARQERENEMMRARGATAADMARRGGEAMVQQAEMSRQSTLLGVEVGGMQGANQAVQAAYANMMGAMGMAHQGSMARTGFFGQMVSGLGQMAIGKAVLTCIPKSTKIDTHNGGVAIENIKPGDLVIGYSGQLVRVLQKHEYLENPNNKRFYKITFKGKNNNTHEVDLCDMHKVFSVRAKDIKENVISKKLYSGVKYSYDLLTEDLGYRINGIPVNSMIEELAELAVKLNNK